MESDPNNKLPQCAGGRWSISHTVWLEKPRQGLEELRTGLVYFWRCAELNGQRRSVTGILAELAKEGGHGLVALNRRFDPHDRINLRQS